jgi:hypothetical protein
MLLRPAPTLVGYQPGSFDEFEERLGAHLERLQARGIDAYRPPLR